ncbi:hypothetical protein [Streptosporangium carneum]|uniref:Uncharacterized protein n=1 Tax=Streptosporangium carneum TaxID=47481 RepID=A0A9W6MC58_9ACTN|nr:hypothetical protein [Streptosporangium carneum]GLK08742.1 hypothetical protein GCM10017600_21470 [Streptosporangium carneum]
MANEDMPEQTSAKGQPMVRATPRDVVYIRLASFGFIPVAVLAVFGFATGTTWLIVAMAVLAVILIGVITVGVRRQSRNSRDGITTEAG